MVLEGAPQLESHLGAAVNGVQQTMDTVSSPAAGTAGSSHDIAAVDTPAVTTKSKKKPRASLPTVPTRTLRHRTSLPAPAYTTATIEEVKEKLAPEGVTAFREEKIKEREGQVRDVVDMHDGLVRERFHLERFVSILEGYDPVVSVPLLLSKTHVAQIAKKDNSNVFLEVS